MFFLSNTVDDPRTNRKDKKVNTHLEESEIDLHEIDHSHSTDRPHSSSESNNEVFIMNAKPEDRTASFFAQPGILAGIFLKKNKKSPPKRKKMH